MSLALLDAVEHFNGNMLFILQLQQICCIVIQCKLEAFMGKAAFMPVFHTLPEAADRIPRAEQRAVLHEGIGGLYILFRERLRRP